MNTSTLLKSAVAAVIMAVAAPPASLHAHDGERRGWNLQGVWLVSTSPRNCMTGDTIANAGFEGLFTFNEDGTMSAWVQNATITTTRGPSYGLWKRKHRRHEHQVKFVHLRYSPATGAYLGRQEAAGTLTLAASGEEFVGDTTTSVRDVNGAEVAAGCAYSSGVRLRLPE